MGGMRGRGGSAASGRGKLFAGYTCMLCNFHSSRCILLGITSFPGEQVAVVAERACLSEGAGADFATTWVVAGPTWVVAGPTWVVAGAPLHVVAWHRVEGAEA